MSPFPTHRQLSAWTGMCPGNEESAGKRRKRRITPGNRWLKRTLVQAAWAASHTKNSYLASQYRRLVGRQGKKRALIAVGHSILVILYYLLKDVGSMRIWAPTFLTASNPNASPVVTSIAFNIWDTRSHSNPASQSDPNFQGRLRRDLHPLATEHARRTTREKPRLSPGLLSICPLLTEAARSRPAAPSDPSSPGIPPPVLPAGCGIRSPGSRRSARIRPRRSGG